MGRTPREDVQIQRRRQLVAQWYLQCWPQAAIARELGVSQSTVSSDLKTIRRQWRESQIRDFDEAVTVELKRVDALEREAWSAWQRSQEPAEMTRVTSDPKGKRAEKTVRQQPGDPRFLERIHRCIASRRALLGLDAPTRIAPTSPDGQESYHAHVMMELMRLAEQAKDGPVVIDADYIQRRIEQTSAEDDRQAEHAGSGERASPQPAIGEIHEHDPLREE